MTQQAAPRLSWYARSVKFVRDIPHRLAAIPESPHEIAKGFAVGAFIGILPALGVPIAFLAAIVFKLSRTATVLGCLVANPWTNPIIYAVSYQIGSVFITLQEPVQWKRIFTFGSGWHNELGRIALPLCLGATILGLVIASVCYVIVRIILARYKAVRLHPPEFLHLHHHHNKDHREPKSGEPLSP